MLSKQHSFTGTLNARDCKCHIPHSFDVPANCGQLDIRLHFEPFLVQGKENMITLTLFDPAGFRGAGHRGGNHHVVGINAGSATPGYLAGELPPGTWIVQLDTHMIMPGDPVNFQLEVTCSESSAATIPGSSTAQTQPTRTSQRGLGWYRGDLHSHTDHSDANRSVSDLLQTAREYKLDFIFLTDHNTVSHLVGIEEMASADLLVAGGLELTTFFGHALCLGTRQWVDWRVRPATGEMPEIATATYEKDQLFIIAHPEAIGDPTCTGCRWRYGDMMPGTAQVVEIWNGPWRGDSFNEQALSLWYDWLNQGRRLVATAGSDTHATADYASRPGFNVIYAEQLSEGALLKAIGAGHLFLSSGPRLGLIAQGADGQRWMMGDQVDQPITLLADWSGCPAEAVVRVIANGRLMAEQMAGGDGRQGWAMTPDQAAWVLVEVRAVTGEMLAITNPIFMADHSHVRG